MKKFIIIGLVTAVAVGLVFANLQGDKAEALNTITTAKLVSVTSKPLVNKPANRVDTALTSQNTLPVNKQPKQNRNITRREQKKLN